MSDSRKYSGAPKGAPILKNEGTIHGVSDDYYATQAPARKGAGSILTGETDRTRQAASAQMEETVNKAPTEAPTYKESPHIRESADGPHQKTGRMEAGAAHHTNTGRAGTTESVRVYSGHSDIVETPADIQADGFIKSADDRSQTRPRQDITQSEYIHENAWPDNSRRQEGRTAYGRSPHVRTEYFDDGSAPIGSGSVTPDVGRTAHARVQGQPYNGLYDESPLMNNANTAQNGASHIRTVEYEGHGTERVRTSGTYNNTRARVAEDVTPGYQALHGAEGGEGQYRDGNATKGPRVRNAVESYTHANVGAGGSAHVRAGGNASTHVRTAENGVPNARVKSPVLNTEEGTVGYGTAKASPVQASANPRTRFDTENTGRANTGKNEGAHVRVVENNTVRARTSEQITGEAGLNATAGTASGIGKKASAPIKSGSGTNPRVRTGEGDSGHVRVNENEPAHARVMNGKPISRQAGNGSPAIESPGGHARQQSPGGGTSPRVRTTAGPAARLKKEGALAKEPAAGAAGNKAGAVFLDKTKVTTEGRAVPIPAAGTGRQTPSAPAGGGHTRTSVPIKNRKMLSAIKRRNTGDTMADINGKMAGKPPASGGLKEEAVRKITTNPGNAKSVFAAVGTGATAAASVGKPRKGIEAITTGGGSKTGSITGSPKGVVNAVKTEQKKSLPGTVSDKKSMDDQPETGKHGVRTKESNVRTRSGAGLAKTKKDAGPGGVNKKRRPLPVIGKLVRKITGQADTIDETDQVVSMPPARTAKRRKGLPLFALALSVSVAVGGYNINETRSNLAVAGYQAYDETDPDSVNLTTTAAGMLDDRLGAYQSKIMYGSAAGSWSGSATGGMPGTEVGDTSGSLSGAVDLTNHDNWYTYDHTLSEFLAALDEVAAEARNNGWIYGDSHGAMPGDDGQSSCDGLIDRALMKMGLTYRPAGRRLVVSDIPIYFPNLGFSVITDENDHMPGDVPVFVPIVGATNKSWHTFAIESVNPDGTVNKYDFGMTERMQSMQPMQAEFDQWPERVFLCTLRGNWKDSAGSVGTGGGTHLPTQGGTSGTYAAASKNLVSVPCRNASMNGSGISGDFPNGVARYTMQHTYNADATYIYHDKIILDEEDERYETAEVDEEGNHYVIVDRVEQTKTDITENIRVKDTSVSMIYTDKDGNTACATDAIYIKDGKLEYNEELYLKAIIGSATVRSDNKELDPDKYLSYVTDMIDASVLAAGGYDVELMTYETGQVRQWSLAEHEGTATANEVAIRARVTINIDCCLPEIIKKDSSHNWTKDEKAKALEYYEMDYPLFCMYHRIELARGSSGGLTGDAAEIYQYLSEAGLDDVHIAAILGNFMQESGLNPDAVQGSRWTAADFDKINYDGSDGGVNGPKGASRGYGLAQWTRGRANTLQSFADLKSKSWRDMETQVKFFLEEYKSNTTGSPWLRGAASRMAFLAASDVDTATKVFFDDFEQPGDSTLPVRQRYAREFLAQIMAGGADVESYMKWAEKIAADNSHGYSQASRDGNPDYDCSSFVAGALKAAGFDVGEGYFTTATEPSLLRKAGFTEMAYKEDALERGDILWIRNGTRNHTEFYCGNGKTIGAHSSHGNTAPGDQNGNEISVIANNGNWEKIFRAPAAASADNADLSLEADVKFNTYGSVGGVKCVVNGISNVGQGANAFAVDIIYGADSIGSHDHCYAYAEGIWGAASTPGPTGKNYQYYNEDKNYEHNGNWYNNWVKLKVCWWKDGTFRGYINNQQVFEDHASMTPQIVNIESTVISNGARIDAEFRNVKVKYALNGKYGTRGNWQTMGWFGLTSRLTASGRTVGGNSGYCTNGAPTYGVSALLGGTATGADGMNWDTTMSYTGKPLSSYLQIGLNL